MMDHGRIAVAPCHVNCAHLLGPLLQLQPLGQHIVHPPTLLLISILQRGKLRINGVHGGLRANLQPLREFIIRDSHVSQPSKSIQDDLINRRNAKLYEVHKKISGNCTNLVQDCVVVGKGLLQDLHFLLKVAPSLLHCIVLTLFLLSKISLILKAITRF